MFDYKEYEKSVAEMKERGVSGEVLAMEKMDKFKAEMVDEFCKRAAAADLDFLDLWKAKNWAQASLDGKGMKAKKFLIKQSKQKPMLFNNTSFFLEGDFFTKNSWAITKKLRAMKVDTKEGDKK